MNAPKRQARPGVTYTSSTTPGSAGKSKLSGGSAVATRDMFGELLGKTKMGQNKSPRKTWGS